jgi:hypothetical protein
MADYQSALDAVLEQLRRKGMEARGRIEPVEGEPLPKLIIEYKPPKAAEFIVVNLDMNNPKDPPDA